MGKLKFLWNVLPAGAAYGILCAIDASSLTKVMKARIYHSMCFVGILAVLYGIIYLVSNFKICRKNPNNKNKKLSGNQEYGSADSPARLVPAEEIVAEPECSITSGKLDENRTHVKRADEEPDGMLSSPLAFLCMLIACTIVIGATIALCRKYGQ